MRPLSSATFPLEVEWNLTWACNAACHFCSTAQYDLASIDTQWKTSIEEIRKCRPLFVTLTGGEPLLHPSFSMIVDALLSNGHKINITTNGRLIEKRITPQQLGRINWIRVSLHAGEQSTATSIFGAAYCLDEVRRGVIYARSHTNRISGFTVITQENCSSAAIGKIFEFAHSLGLRQLDFGVMKLLGNARASQLPSRASLSQAMDFIREYSAYYAMQCSLPVLEERLHSCTSVSYSLSIMPDHTVGDCTFAGDDSIGSIDVEGLEAIWSRHRNRTLTCNKCAEGGYFLDHRPAKGVIPIQLTR